MRNVWRATLQGCLSVASAVGSVFVVILSSTTQWQQKFCNATLLITFPAEFSQAVGFSQSSVVEDTSLLECDTVSVK